MKRFLLFCLLSGRALAQETYCNPMDIDYRYGFEQINDGASYRSGADPVIVPHNGSYYMFVTISGGWWKSTDLKHWSFVKPSMWPFEDMCAPAAISAPLHPGEPNSLLLFQSTFESRPILKVTDPDHGGLEFYNRWLPRMKGAEGPWDPSLFRDPKSDRWFMYFGSSNTFPLYGIELDPDKNLTYKGAPQGLLKLHPEDHGWERFGQDHSSDITPFTEGAWMNEHNGKYYLQYGAPGTEYNVYSTGTYVGDGPMGPFRYAPYNPVAYRPGGLATGIGHGNTFADLNGDWWMTGTCWIGLNWGMERRLVLAPAGFDADGQLHADTRFGDWPHTLSRSGESFTGWMLLSRGKPVVASSCSADREHAPAAAVDENLRTYWLAGNNQAGETLTVDLQAMCEVRAVQVDYADHQSGIWKHDDSVYTQFKLWGSQDGQSWSVLSDLTDSGGEPRRDRACAYQQLKSPARVRFVRYEHGYTAGPHLALADLRVFGRAPGEAPARPSAVEARRDADPRNCQVSWKAVPGARGYNVRWGLSQDKLYQTYQVWSEAGTRLNIRALNRGVGYSFAVEAFNESGVSPLSPPVSIL